MPFLTAPDTGRFHCYAEFPGQLPIGFAAPVAGTGITTCFRSYPVGPPYCSAALTARIAERQPSEVSGQISLAPRNLSQTFDVSDVRYRSGTARES
jgi:hypothetical protein